MLTRDAVRSAMRRATVAPITSTAKGLGTEVRIGISNGLDHDCVISCDNFVTIGKGALGCHLGYLFDHQEATLAQAIVNAFALQIAGVD